MTAFTIEAQEQLGEFVQQAGKTFLVIRTADVFGNPVKLKITPKDVAEFCRTQQTGSSVRTLAGLDGDWRPMLQLAQIAFDWFKQVDVVGMRRAAKRFGLVPQF